MFDSRIECIRSGRKKEKSKVLFSSHIVHTHTHTQKACFFFLKEVSYELWRYFPHSFPTFASASHQLRRSLTKFGDPSPSAECMSVEAL